MYAIATSRSSPALRASSRLRSSLSFPSMSPRLSSTVPMVLSAWASASVSPSRSASAYALWPHANVSSGRRPGARGKTAPRTRAPARFPAGAVRGVWVASRASTRASAVRPTSPFSRARSRRTSPALSELAGVPVDRERLVQRRERLLAQVRQKPLVGEPLQQLRPPLGRESRREPQRAPVLVQSLAVRTNRRGMLCRRRGVAEHGAVSPAASA